MNRCRIEWTTNWWKNIFDIRFATSTSGRNTEVWRTGWNVVIHSIWLFLPYSDVIEKRQIYRFVEQLNLYRLVYNSISLEKQIEEKIENIIVVSHLFLWKIGEKWPYRAEFHSSYPRSRMFWKKVLYMNRCRIKRATNW